ncbi:hypothetical protein [Amycolatopsis jejuensis]|uniref:hypothetical protein n=1 Tax=Amycolatopsis jejuensis TaxID=330084 RepID=UPI000524D1AC|nr:hypothetical protein [Amycolatopsis jejuensis]
MGTSVADGAIAVIVSGSASTTVPEAPPAELSEACELCSGVVMLDLTRCDIDDGTVVATVDGAAFHARRYRCRICVVTADPEVRSACALAGLFVAGARQCPLPERPVRRDELPSPRTAEPAVS